jgi:signal transduction histidine kinase
VDRDDVRERLREYLRSLRVRTTDAPLRPTGWEWFSDIALGIAMSFAVLNSRLHHVNDNPHLFYGSDHFIGGGPTDVLRALLATLPLAVRRRYPLAALWTMVVATLNMGVQNGSTETALFAFVSCLIAAYSAAIHSPYRRASVLSIAVSVVLLIAHHGVVLPGVGTGLVPFLMLIPIVLGANAIGNWRQKVRDLEEQQDAAMQQAVEQERSRIAAELHDVVTHNVSVMVVQAGAARKILETSPELAREALVAVETSGRAAMAELRHVMGLLTMTSAGPDADLAPQPGLDQVPALVDRIREAGVEVEFAVRGDSLPLPSGIDLAAYRVVQEALTNTVKHAQGARVRVTVDYSPTVLRVEVADSGGTPSPAAASGNGRGLIGLRQRLAVYGGTLRAAPRMSGGYRVSAMIPLEG